MTLSYYQVLPILENIANDNFQKICIKLISNCRPGWEIFNEMERELIKILGKALLGLRLHLKPVGFNCKDKDI